MRKGNIWDRTLKTSKSPYGGWRIDNGRSDSKWNSEIAKKALEKRKDIEKDANGYYYQEVQNKDGSYSQVYLNDPIMPKKKLSPNRAKKTPIVRFEDLSPKEKEEL